MAISRRQTGILNILGNPSSSYHNDVPLSFSKFAMLICLSFCRRTVVMERTTPGLLRGTDTYVIVLSYATPKQSPVRAGERLTDRLGPGL